MSVLPVSCVRLSTQVGDLPVLLQPWQTTRLLRAIWNLHFDYSCPYKMPHRTQTVAWVKQNVQKILFFSGTSLKIIFSMFFFFCLPIPPGARTVSAITSSVPSHITHEFDWTAPWKRFSNSAKSVSSLALLSKNMLFHNCWPLDSNWIKSWRHVNV